MCVYLACTSTQQSREKLVFLGYVLLWLELRINDVSISKVYAHQLCIQPPKHPHFQMLYSKWKCGRLVATVNTVAGCLCVTIKGIHKRVIFSKV